MKYRCLATLVAVSALVPCVSLAQGLSITNYQFVSEQRASLTSSYVTYRADLVNSGPALASVQATLTSLNPTSFTVKAGQGTLNFAPVPANSQVTSSNTFTILVNRTVAFDPTFGQLQWTFQPVPLAPVANAGPNQSATVGKTVTLDGSKSTNPSGIGTLTFSWMFTSRPAGSSATLMNPASMTPTFVPDVSGSYVIQLTVGNGVASSSASVTVSTTAPPAPVANAGPNQTVNVGATVVLNGSGSTSGSGNPLTYAWTLTSRPAGSTATLTGANTVSPTFVADKAGSYMAQLIVNDGIASSAPSTVTISTSCVKPVANAGPNQLVNVNSVVQLNGSGSTDACGLPLTYQWTLLSMPAGSTATLSNPTAVNPTFTADRPGTYTAQLIVSDGTLSSDPATVVITTSAPLAPTANAGTNQTVNVGSTVQLNGSGTDPQNLPLTFQWTITNKPAGSAATLSSSTIANPTFVADLAGTYVAQLVVNNGFQSSAPSTVTISTTCSQPTANPGPNQNVTVGATVKLDGSASGDACHDPLTYSWSLTTRPAGSTATLSGANTVSPTFVADVAGMYVAQLIVNNGFTSSNPATVTITASPLPVINLTPNPLSVTANGSGTLTVTLSSAAGGSGQVVNLSSSNTGVATVPANVTVPSGATNVMFSVTGVAQGSATITASASGFVSGTATVNVATPVINVPANISVALGQSATFAVTLSQPAATPVTVMLTSSDPSKVTVPASVSIAAGATAPAMQPQVTGAGIGSATITASANGYTSGSGTVTVTAPTMSFAGPLSIAVGAMGNLTLNLSGGQAPAGGLTVTLSSSDTSKATVPATVSFAAGATSVPVPVTGVAAGTATITASATGIANATANVTVTPTPVITLTPNPLSVNTNASSTLTVTLSTAAGAGGQVVNLSSSNTGVATVPANVTVPSGATNVMFSVTGVSQGSATITASASGFVSGTASVNVANPVINVSANTSVALGQSATFAVTLSQPAATPVTVMLASSDPSKVTVPASVSIAAGATAPATQPQVTGAGIGSATITASASGYTSGSGTVTVTAPTMSFAGPLSIAVGAMGNLTLNLSGGQAPAGGLTVSLSSNDTSKATVPTTVSFAAGTTSVPVPVTGVGAGMATITASATGIANATANVTVTPVVSGPMLAFSPNSLTVPPGSQQNLSLTVTPAQANAFMVSLSSSNTGVATVPSSVNVPANATSVNVPVTGVSGGTTTITASAAGSANAIASVNVCAVCSAITVTPGSVGVNLQTLITITLNPAPPSGSTVTLTSGDPSVFLVAAQGTAAGSASTTLMLSSGVGVTQAFIQGIGIGTATLTASAPGFTAGTSTVSVTPSGFVLSGPNGIGASFQTFPGVNTTVAINSAQLDANNNFVQVQQLRATASATVQLNNSNPGAGSVSAASVSFTGGVDTRIVTFTGGSTGSTTVTAVPPAGFSTPQTGGLPANSLFITVLPQGLVPQNATVGQSLETTTFTKLNGLATQSECPGTGGLLVTLTSNSPSLLLSTTATGVGSASIMVCVPPGSSRTPDYFVYGLANSGNATYTATSSIGNSSSTCAGPTPVGCVTFVPSGIVIAGPSGNPGQGFTTGMSLGNSVLTVFSVTLNGGTVGMSQAVAGGANVSVNVTSSNTAVGTVSPTLVNIPGGSQSNTTTFTPVAQGMTDVTVSVPPGFSTPNADLTKVTVTVAAIGFQITDGTVNAPLLIGNNLEIQGSLNAGAPGPATITLTSNSPNLKLSTTPDGAGSSMIQLNLPAGTTGPLFYYMQATGSSGAVSYTASAPGFTSKTAMNLALSPSGFVIVGPFGIGQGWNFPANVPTGSQTQLQVFPAQLDASGNFVQTELLSGSAPAATVPINVSGVGSVTPSPVIVMPGSNGAVTQFSSSTPGASKVSITQPAGYTKPVGVQGFQMPGPSCPTVAQCPDPTFVVFNVQ